MKKNVRLLIPILIVLAALTARLVPGPRTIDDAFITFRYARNILAGEGFVYNPGERILGTTTPLYTFLMVGIGTLSGGTAAPFPVIALVCNAVFDAATCLLLWQLGKHLNAGRVGIAAALVWAIAPYSVTFAIGGLETSLYVLLLTAAILAYTKKRTALAALCASLSFVTRPDALILVGPLVLDRFIRAVHPRLKERFHVQEFLALFLPPIIWNAFAWLYFGSPIPHSVQAKLIVYQLNPADSFIRLIQHFATPFQMHHLVEARIWIAVGIILYPFLFFVGARKIWKSEPRLLTWLLYPWLYLLTFSISNPLIFRWYLTPPLPAYILGILFGADQLLTAVFTVRQTRDKAIWRKALPAGLLLIIPVMTTLNAWSLHPDHGNNRPAPEMAYIKLELLYQEAAKTIMPELKEGQVIAAGDVGVLGFTTNATILDTVGLNSPQSLSYYPIGADRYEINYAIPTNLILDQSPDWIIVQEVYARHTFLQDEQFHQLYQQQTVLDNDIYGSQGMLIFRRDTGNSSPGD